MMTTLGGFLKGFGGWFVKTFDAADFIGLGGLGMIFYGLHQWKPFIAYIIVGSIIFCLSILAGFRR